jgi:lactam utilization protein B
LLWQARWWTEAMAKAVQAAIKHDVVIGAHVGYEDRENFGRFDVEMDYDSLRKLTFDQIHDLLDIVGKCSWCNHEIRKASRCALPSNRKRS